MNRIVFSADADVKEVPNFQPRTWSAQIWYWNHREGHTSHCDIPKFIDQSLDEYLDPQLHDSFFWLCIWYFNYPNILIWLGFTHFLHGISIALAGGPLRGGGAAAALCAESGGGTLLLAADWRAYGDGTCYGMCWVFQRCPIGSRISHDKDLKSQNFFVDLWLCHSERIDMWWGYCLNGIVDQQVGRRIVETMGFSLHGPSEQCTNAQTTSTCVCYICYLLQSLYLVWFYYTNTNTTKTLI